MVAKEKEKLCIQCEGRIPLHTDICPYCASDQNSGRKSFHSPLFQHQSLQESLTSLYTPPYQGKVPQFDTTAPGAAPRTHPEPAAQEPSFSYEKTAQYKDVTPLYSQEPSGSNETTEPEEPTETTKSSLWPSLCLTLGTFLFLMGFMQMAFGQNGILRMEWNAKYWFFYLFFSIPCFFAGVKQLKNRR